MYRHLHYASIYSKKSFNLLLFMYFTLKDFEKPDEKQIIINLLQFVVVLSYLRREYAKRGNDTVNRDTFEAGFH